jgi:diguanylate cyclase (GGDEF)-like protein
MQVLATAILLLCSRERATRAPRRLMSAFLFAFAGLECARGYIAFVLHRNPDVFSASLQLLCIVADTVSTSVLPLAFIWMINARLEADLIQKSLVDPLTQVLNRRGLYEELDREIARSHRYAEQLNDTYGHAVGDAVLIGVARLMAGMLRRTDTIARIGGEEFVLLLPHTSSHEATQMLERLRVGVSEYRLETLYGIVYGLDAEDASHVRRTLRITASFGVTVTGPSRSATAAQLLRDAVATVSLSTQKRTPW